jgi:NTP pyrophosphatase (non-canonical NTP hydrolase)
MKTEFNLNQLRDTCHNASRQAGWYTNPQTGEALIRNVPEMLCLIHSEVSEALEGYRKNLMDDHLPHRKMIEAELADVLIRIGDLAGYLNLELDETVREKLAYNAQRQDHKLETRKLGGKQF